MSCACVESDSEDSHPRSAMFTRERRSHRFSVNQTRQTWRAGGWKLGELDRHWFAYVDVVLGASPVLRNNSTAILARVHHVFYDHHQLLSFSRPHGTCVQAIGPGSSGTDTAG